LKGEKGRAGVSSLVEKERKPGEAHITPKCTEMCHFSCLQDIFEDDHGHASCLHILFAKGHVIASVAMRGRISHLVKINDTDIERDAYPTVVWTRERLREAVGHSLSNGSATEKSRRHKGTNPQRKEGNKRTKEEKKNRNEIEKKQERMEEMKRFK
jgi:hypothetical protein